MKKHIAVMMIILIAAAGILTGCRKSGVSDIQKQGQTGTSTAAQGQDGNNNGKNGELEDNSKDGNFPLVITDANGTEMTIKEKPQRIASISLVSDEMLFSLVDTESIVAITHLAKDNVISNVADKAGAIPTTLTQSDTEKTIALAPDLVIVPTWTDKAFIQQLRDANITVYTMGTANDIEQVKSIIREVSVVVGEVEKGMEVIAWMDEKLKAVEDKVGSIKESDKKRVLVCDAFWCTYAKGTSSDDIVRRAGLINVATEAGLEGWPQVSKENIIMWNPDIIFLPAWSYDNAYDPEEFRKSFLSDASLKDVSAIKNGRVYILEDKHMTSTSQYMVLGIEDAAKAAYPELFE
ncbi:MAG TPA: ABC transporter substrate-binding protein [Clostridiaceae bacterium]|nr:ABC transporter substrate-binding protein [Clostridiaceae bacterium]